MAFYPFYETLNTASQSMPQGNFGLWYNKFIPLTENDFNPSDERGDKNNNVEHYCRKYSEGPVKSHILKELLAKKHDAQKGFCTTYPVDKFEIIEIEARLVSPLITGVGESHPHKVSMVFDHNLGVPYIPASGVKGIVRFAHTLTVLDLGIPEEYLKTDKKTGLEYVDDETYEAIYAPFGNQKNKGWVVFLDAYPLNVPHLHVDIMNPHYGPYYSDGLSPADHHDPKPIKFLTVEAKTSFIFRAITEKKNDLPDKVRAAFTKALTEEGVGAKTAVGYGKFEIDETVQNAVKNKAEKAEPSPLEKCFTPFKLIKPSDAGKIGPLIDSALKSLPSDEDKKVFASYVKEFMGSDFKKSKAREKLKSYLS